MKLIRTSDSFKNREEMEQAIVKIAPPDLPNKDLDG